MAEMSLTPADWRDAECFLDTLENGDTFTFQTFPERADAKRVRKPAILHGTWKDHKDELARLNALGSGIFVTVNKTDGNGRKADNIQRVRAHFVDLDGAPIQPILHLPIEGQPHMIVETSPGRWHVYWLIEDCPLSEFKERQQRIADRFGGDRSVCDLPRVMRLPGFLHQKTSTPHRSRLIPQQEWKKLSQAKP